MNKSQLLTELQKYISERAVEDKWCGLHKNNQEFFNHIIQEMMETIQAYNSCEQDKHLPHFHGLWVEFTDIIMLMLHMADKNDIDLGRVLSEKMAVNSLRAKVTKNERG